MSKGKEFPPRVKLFVWDDGQRLSVGNSLHQKREEYLSVEEHSHLLAEARREGRVEAYRHAAEKTANADNQYWEQCFRELAKQAAEEGDA